VVEVTPSNVVVRLAGTETYPKLIRFDANGKGCDSSDIYDGIHFYMDDSGIPCSEEGPWELVEEDPYKNRL